MLSSGKLLDILFINKSPHDECPALRKGLEIAHALVWVPVSSWVPWGSLDVSELENTQDQKGSSHLRSGSVLVPPPSL